MDTATETGDDPAAILAELRERAKDRAGSRNEWYIIMPAAPWGGKQATFGPFSEEDARARLDVWVPHPDLFTPPKLLRVAEDYEAEAITRELTGKETGDG